MKNTIMISVHVWTTSSQAAITPAGMTVTDRAVPYLGQRGS